MKLIIIFLILILLPPTYIPKNLDQVFYAIDTNQSGWTFTHECPKELGSNISWKEIKSIPDDNGKETLTLRGKAYTEKEIFSRGIVEVIKGNLLTCKPVDDKVIFYGKGIDNILGGD